MSRNVCTKVHALDLAWDSCARHAVSLLRIFRALPA